MPAGPGTAPLVVGLSSNVLDPAFSPGGLDGIGVYTTALERALRAEGVTTRRVGAPGVRGARLRRPAAADVRLATPLVPAIAWSALTGAALPFEGALDAAIDVYHSTDYRTPRLARIPVVATLYDAIPLMRPEWASPRLRGAKNWLLRKAAAHADRVIAISEAAVDELVEHYRIARERIRVVHLGVAGEWFDEPSEPTRERLRELVDLRPGYFLFVGTLQPRKNLRVVLDAYDRLDAAAQRDHQLVIVGRYGWGAEDLRNELLARREAKRVLWLRYVDDDVLRALYRDAGVFVFPSLAEGFGLPVLDALASGLPVVASDLPVLREVAGEHAAFVSPRDVDAWSAAMARSLTVSRDDASDAQRRAWARRFDWRTCALRTIDVYRELVPVSS